MIAMALACGTMAAGCMAQRMDLASRAPPRVAPAADSRADWLRVRPQRAE
jgi:hypothetical protein